MATEKSSQTAEAAPIMAFKGFDKNMQCRGFQFEVGKTYEHEGKVKSCESGFHACKHPLSVFNFYAPATSRFAEVRMSGEVHDENSSDTKIAAARISIKVELSLPDLVKRAWDYVWSRATVDGEVATGDYGAASSTGYQGAASSTGDYGAASSTGYQGAASSTGKAGHASATGPNGKVMGAEGCSLLVREFDDDLNLIAIACGIVGKDGIKSGTWYRCVGGKLVEVL